MWYEFTIGEVDRFEYIPASGIPARGPFVRFALVWKRDPATDGGGLMDRVIALDKSPRIIVTAKHCLGVVLAYLFLKEDHYV
jgi:hypothetical protein